MSEREARYRIWFEANIPEGKKAILSPTRAFIWFPPPWKGKGSRTRHPWIEVALPDTTIAHSRMYELQICNPERFRLASLKVDDAEQLAPGSTPIIVPNDLASWALPGTTGPGRYELTILNVAEAPPSLGGDREHFLAALTGKCLVR